MPNEFASPREEIAALYSKYGALVHRRCAQLLRDEEAARDAAQDVFVKAFRAIDRFRRESSPLTWVLQIATHHCLNILASNKAKWRDEFRRREEHAALLSSSSEVDTDRLRIVRRLLGRLDVETQRVAVHYYVDEMTQAEIGEAIGRSLPTVRKRLAKFERIAKKELGDDILE